MNSARVETPRRASPPPIPLPPFPWVNKFHRLALPRDGFTLSRSLRLSARLRCSTFLWERPSFSSKASKVKDLPDRHYYFAILGDISISRRGSRRDVWIVRGVEYFLHGTNRRERCRSRAPDVGYFSFKSGLNRFFVNGERTVTFLSVSRRLDFRWRSNRSIAIEQLSNVS